MKIKNVLAGILSASIVTPVLLSGLTSTVNAISDIQINSSNFPDANFLAYVQNNFDLNKDSYLSPSEIYLVTSMNLSNEGAKISDGVGAGSAKLDQSKVVEITNLKGIEYFTYLESLNVSYNLNLTSINLSHNTELKKLNVHNTGIDMLNILSLSKLSELRAWNTNLKSINLSKNPELKYLDVSYTEVTKLNVINNPLLAKLADTTPSKKDWLGSQYNCYKNDVATINCNVNTKVTLETGSGIALTENNFGDTKFCNYLAAKLDSNGDGYLSNSELNVTSLDLKADNISESFGTIKGLSNLVGLEYLDFNRSKIDSLDISNCTSLKTVDCEYCNLKSINFDNCPKISDLYITGCYLYEIDFSSLPKLYKLSCESTKIKTLDLSNNKELQYLTCSRNSLTTLDVSVCPNLVNLSCYGNELTELKIGNELMSIDCSDNQLKELDVSNCTNLTYLNCSKNLLTSLDISTQKSISRLNISNNKIDFIGIQDKTELVALFCEDTLISELDISNLPLLTRITCANTLISELDISNCPELIQAYTNKYEDDEILVGHHDNYTYHYIDHKYFGDILLSYPSNATIICDKNSKPTPTVKPTAAPTTTPSKTPDAKPTSAPNDKPTVAPTTKPGATTAPKPTTAPSNPSATTIPSKPGATTTTAPSKPTATPTPKPTKPQTGVSDKAGTVEDFAERLYTTCLGRESEKAGKDYWVGELKAGKPGSEVAQGFFFSPEFTGLNLSNEEYITRLYRTFMGREPDKDGMNYWLGEMKNGQGRVFVFDGFVNSPEWADICLTYGIRSGGLAEPTFEKQASKEVLAFAERLYTTCLGRDAEPEGLKYWSQELANLRQTGTVAASGFFNSPEFIGLNLKDDEYITRLYRTFMGREPEKAGYDYWMSELKSGKDRQFVFDGFSVAPEFANLCAEAGIMR